MQFVRTIALLIVFSSSTVNAGLLFTLDEGASIFDRSTGQTEALYGSFEIEVDTDYGDLVGFDFVSLNFFSQSFEFSLYGDNEFGLATFYENDLNRCLTGVCNASFGVEALTQGFDVAPGTPMLISGDFGDYEGEADSPTSLLFGNQQVYQSGGGLFLADLSFSASRVNQVSAPNALLLISMSLVVLFRFKK